MSESIAKVVFIRHGESQGNAKNVYTGWDDTPLSIKGEQEAEEAGLCLKAKGLKFDICFTSALQRATKTAERVLKVSGNSSVQVDKSWKLNARHSGGLQGLTQAEAVERYGESKVTLWRSSYDILPACVEHSDPRHPVHDPKYAGVAPELLPPGGESLACTVKRVVPHWKEKIVPRIRAGDSVMVAAHKNSLRALWKHLENVPDEDALDIKMMPASAPLVIEFQIPPVGDDLIFLRKYSLNAPTFNPKVRIDSLSNGVTNKVFFLRHAESLGNAKGIYGGWEDAALSMKGEQQAVQAGLLLKQQGVTITHVFTSVLQRAVKTAELVCGASDNEDVPTTRAWQLNPGHSGVLQGLTEVEAFEMYGEEKVKHWRSSDDVKPESVDLKDPRHPANDKLYAEVPVEELPGGESLHMTAARVWPYWTNNIAPMLTGERNILVVAHRDSLRALFGHLEAVEAATVFDGTSQTAPLVYEFGNDGTFFKKYSLSTMSPELGLSPKHLGLLRFHNQPGVDYEKVGQVVFLRHGESECNLKEQFTGWEDSGMTPKGFEQARKAGKYLKDHGFQFDIVFTSVLSRAIESAVLICEDSENKDVPIEKAWQLNARHPGVLQGLTKEVAVSLYGKEKVNIWRGSYDVMPECVGLDDNRHPVNNPLYSGIPKRELPPGGESLARTVDRIGWSLAEDHIQFTIGRHSYNLKKLENAAESLKSLLHVNSHQNPMQQASMLKEFIFVYKQYLHSLVGPKTIVDGEFPRLPVPFALSNSIKVLLGKPLKEIEDVMVEARGVQFADEDLCDRNWTRLEEVLVSSCHEDSYLCGGLPTLSCATAETKNERSPLAVVGESVTLQVLLENPLDVPLVLTELFLLWKFHPHSLGSPEGGPNGGGSATGSAGSGGGPTEASRAITNETERENLLAAKEVVTTEVLSDFYLLPCERKPVELSVAPKTVGKLAITGLAFSLGASAPSQHSQSGHHLSSTTSTASSSTSSSFLGAASETLGDVESVRVKGKVALTVRGARLPSPGSPAYARDHRLELRVVESMPLLRVAFSEFPERLLCGEVRLISMQISNVGQQPLTRLRLTTNLAGILTFGFDEYVHMLNSDVYQTLTGSEAAGGRCDVSCVRPSVKDYIEVPLTSPGVLVPGASVSLPCWLRGPDSPGRSQVKMLFYYESTEPSPHMKFRVLRHRCELDVLPSLRLKASVRRSQGPNANNLVVITETENSYSREEANSSKSIEFDILQVSSASHHWSLQAMGEEWTGHRPSLKPQESFCSNFLLTPSKVSPASGASVLFSSLRVDRSGALINAGGSPCADFFFRTRRRQPPQAPEEPAGPQWKGKSACEMELTLILLWKARLLNMDGSSQTFVGQNHVDVTIIEKWFCEPEVEKPTVLQDPVRFYTPFVEADPSIHMQPWLLQSKLIRTNFKHPPEVTHDFTEDRLLIVRVEVSLFNTANDPVLVRIDANDREANDNCLAKFLWIGTTEEEISLAAKSSSLVSLRACFSAPGVYDLFKLIVKAAFVPGSGFSGQGPSDMGFVKQDYSYSSLITVLSVTS